MLPSGKDYARVARRIEGALDAPAGTPHAVVTTLLDQSADVLAISSACWHGTDPATGSMVDGAAMGSAPGSFEESLVFEYQRPDVNRFADLGAGRQKAGSIGGAGRPPARAFGR